MATAAKHFNNFKEEPSQIFSQRLRFFAFKFIAVFLIGGLFLAGSILAINRLAVRLKEVRTTQRRIFANFEKLAQLSLEKKEADELLISIQAALPSTLELVDNFPDFLKKLSSEAGVSASINFGQEREGSAEEPKYMEVVIRADGRMPDILRFIWLLEKSQFSIRITDFRISESQSLGLFQLYANGRIYVR
jgi:hypothetical protein